MAFWDEAPDVQSVQADWWTSTQMPNGAQPVAPQPMAVDPGAAQGRDFGALASLNFGDAFTPQTYTPGQFTDAAPTFTAPTDVTMQNDPGYLFRLQQAQQGVERSAAAHGTVLNPGTQSAIAQRVGDQATAEFNNVFGRANQSFLNNLQTYGAKYNTFLGNEGLKKSAVDTNNASAFNARQLSDQEKQQQVGIDLAQQNDYWNRLAQLSNAGQTAATDTVRA